MITPSALLFFKGEGEGGGGSKEKMSGREWPDYQDPKAEGLLTIEGEDEEEDDEEAIAGTV